MHVVPDGISCITFQVANWRIWHQQYKLYDGVMRSRRQEVVNCITLCYIGLAALLDI